MTPTQRVLYGLGYLGGATTAYVVAVITREVRWLRRQAAEINSSKKEQK